MHPEVHEADFVGDTTHGAILIAPNVGDPRVQVHERGSVLPVVHMTNRMASESTAIEAMKTVMEIMAAMSRR